MTARFLKKTFTLLSSTGLSCVLFLFLLLLTYLGTVEQVEQGLYVTQAKYFGSLVLVHHAFDVLPIPLPGVYLLLIVLFINLLLGGIVRVRKGWSMLGILLAHAGICVLLIGAFVTFKFSLNGQLTLYEHESGNTFQSYHAWECGIAPVSGGQTVTEYILAEQDFADLEPDESRTFRFGDAPFELVLSGFARNCEVRQAAAEDGARVVDGASLEIRPPEREAERNIPGAYVRINERGAGATQEGILWGMAPTPLTFQAGDRRWQVDLRRRRWTLPFTVFLRTFTRELHPGTNLPKAFSSEVTVIEEETGQEARIAMNEPLRLKGYTLYQSSWGPPDAGPNDRLYSTFAVVKNPAAPFPLYACLIITFGLVAHFTQRLIRYLRKESRRDR